MPRTADLSLAPRSPFGTIVGLALMRRRGQSERVGPGSDDADVTAIDEFEYAPGSIDRRSHRWVLA